MAETFGMDKSGEQDDSDAPRDDSEHQAANMLMRQNAVLEFVRRRLGKERPYRSYAEGMLLK